MIDQSLWHDSRVGSPYRLFPATSDEQTKPPETAQDASSNTTEATPEDPWAVWPYSWAHNSWNFLAKRFHSIHEKQKIEKKNDAENLSEAAQPSENDATLHLV